MEENKVEMQKPVPPAPASPDSETQRELARFRSRNKVLKAATIVLSVLFLLVLAAALFIYHKISEFRDVILQPMMTYQESAPEPGGERLPEALRSVHLSTRASVGSSLTVFTNASEYAPDEAEEGLTVTDGETAAVAFAKYADRPIVKDFMEAAKKDPAFRRALQNRDPDNPQAVFTSLQKSKSMQALTVKFAMRKDFLPFLMEIMNDPETRLMLDKMPGGNAGQIKGFLRSMSVGGRSRSQPQPVTQPETYVPGEDGSNDEMKLDTSVIRDPAPRTAPKAKKKAPPPDTSSSLYRRRGL